MTKGNIPVYNKMIPEMEIKKGEKLFEIGYGHGFGIGSILSQYDCFISGIDFSELMYKMATERNKKYIENKKAVLYFGDLNTADNIPDTYDKIFCLNVIYFWDDLLKPFSKIYSLLNEGGSFYIYMAHKDFLKKAKIVREEVFNMYDIEQVVEKLKLTGFKDVEFKFDNGYIIKSRK